MPETDKPLVTFALFAYNQERFIREAVEGALAQTYSPLEIILSDDCSTDATFKIIESIAADYSGKHRVLTNQNSRNLGLVKHINKILSKVTGDIVIIAAGDDVSLPYRTSQTVELLQLNKNATFVSFRDTIIDADGIEFNRPKYRFGNSPLVITLDSFLRGNHVTLSGASRGFRASVFRDFGDLNELCPTEDTPFLLRALIRGNGLVLAEPGILYRKHDTNLSRPASIASMDFSEIKNQYQKDVQLALDKKWVSKELGQRMYDWIDRNSRLRSFYVSLHEANYSYLFAMKHFFTNKDLSFRQRIILLRDTFRHSGR